MRAPLFAVLLAGCAALPVKEQVSTQPEQPRATWLRSPMPLALPAVARTRPRTTSKILKNGLKVVVVEDHGARLVKARLFLSGGSAGESAEMAGSTWFALALLGETFDERDEDGVPTRPSEQSARTQAVMAGAQLRFEVNPDSSWIGVDGHSLDTGSVLRRLDELITARRHGSFSFQVRAQSVIDLINDLELTDGTVLEQYLSQLAFGADHPYARPVFGTPRSVMQIGLPEIIERQNELLTPAGATLLIAGDVTAAEVFRKAELSFGDWVKTPEEKVRVTPPVVTRRRSVVFLPRRPSRNTLICLTRPLTDVKASDAVTELAVSLLGEARMAPMLREKLGLTYSVSSQLIERRAARALLICARVRATETVNATRLMLAELSSLAATPPTQDELEHVRAMAITHEQLSQDDLDGIVEAWRHAGTMKLPAPSETKVAELQQVTLEELTAVTAKLADQETVQVIFSGERGLVEAAARANALGPLKVPTLGRVTEE